MQCDITKKETERFEKATKSKLNISWSPHQTCWLICSTKIINKQLYNFPMWDKEINNITLRAFKFKANIAYRRLVDAM